jgi:hypothetical protein
MKTIENIKIVGRNQMIFDLIERNTEGGILSNEMVFGPFDRCGLDMYEQAQTYLSGEYIEKKRLSALNNL